MSGQTFPDHFSAVAPAYSSYRPTYPDSLFAYLSELAPGHALAWDCAAGSGQATLGLVPYFERVIATDASATQIAQAPQHQKVEYRVASAEASGLPAGSVDLIVVAQALHWLDLERFYAEARRVLAPAGLLAVWSYPMQRTGDAAIDHVLSHFYSEVVGAWWPPQRHMVETGYRTVPFPFEEIAPPIFDMVACWSLPQLLGYIGTWSATSRYRAATGNDPLPELACALAPLWGRPEDEKRILWPLEPRVGRLTP
jgi:SAM-dependent methyltransferase